MKPDDDGVERRTFLRAVFSLLTGTRIHNTYLSPRRSKQFLAQSRGATEILDAHPVGELVQLHYQQPDYFAHRRACTELHAFEGLDHPGTIVDVFDSELVDRLEERNREWEKRTGLAYPGI